MLQPRHAVLLFLSLLVVVPAASAAPEAGRGVRFAFLPTKAFQAKPVTVRVAVRPLAARCTLAVRYADGSHQRGLAPTRARRGVASWRWTVPVTADAGPATVSASCRGAGRVTRRLVVVGGTELPPSVRLVVERQGWTQRNMRIGSHVSYGIVFANPDPNHDATSVRFLLNFVDATGRVIASRTHSFAGVAAGSSYALGSYLSLSTQTPIARTEVVIQAAKPAPKRLHFPALQNVVLQPTGSTDPGWLNAVFGELVNSHPTLRLSRARLSIVIFDQAGAVVGGGSASVWTDLPPGARVLFSAQSSFKSIPIDRAAAWQITVEPQWTNPD